MDQISGFIHKINRDLITLDINYVTNPGLGGPIQSDLQQAGKENLGEVEDLLRLAHGRGEWGQTLRFRTEEKPVLHQLPIGIGSPELNVRPLDSIFDSSRERRLPCRRLFFENIIPEIKGKFVHPPINVKNIKNSRLEGGAPRGKSCERAGKPVHNCLRSTVQFRARTLEKLDRRGVG